MDKYISQGRFLNDMKMQQFKIGIAAGILIPLLCLMYMCFVGMLLLCREKHQASVYKEENEDMASKKRYACIAVKYHCSNYKTYFSGVPGRISGVVCWLVEWVVA